MKRSLVILVVLAAAAYLASRAVSCTSDVGRALDSLSGQSPANSPESAVSAKAAPAEPGAAPHGEPFPGGQLCSVREIVASSSSQSAEPGLDPELKPIRDKLERPPFTAWSAFEQLDRVYFASSSDRAELSGGTTMTLALLEESEDAPLVHIQIFAGDRLSMSTRARLRYGDAFLIVTSPQADDARILWLHCERGEAGR